MSRVWVLPAFACAFAPGCSLLFEPGSTGGDSAPDAAPPLHVECLGDPAEECPAGATACHCGLCAREDTGCPGTRLAYVLADGSRACVPAAAGVDASFNRTCAVATDGSIWCWGDNSTGVLGDPSVVGGASLAPVRIARAPSSAPAVQVVVSIYHACARLEDGTVECWGGNQTAGDSPEVGLLGAGVQIASSPTPLQVIDDHEAPLLDVEGIAAEGAHTCARDAERQLWCWGANSHAQLGTGDAIPREHASLALSGVVSPLALGSEHTCARVRPEDGEDQTRCWGRQNLGQIGDNGLVDCALENEYDELEPQTVVLESAPATPLSPVVNLGAGKHFACAVTANPQEIYCWGQNEDFALGDVGDPDPEADFGSTACAARPNVLALEDFVDTIDGGQDFACALVAQRVYCWGSHGKLQQGPGPAEGVKHTAPGDPIPGLRGVTELATGWQHACAVTGEGKVFCWGDNGHGQLGDGTRSNRADPVEVPLCP